MLLTITVFTKRSLCVAPLTKVVQKQVQLLGLK